MLLPGPETTLPFIEQDTSGSWAHSPQPQLTESKASAGFQPLTGHGAEQSGKPGRAGDFQASLGGGGGQFIWMRAESTGQVSQNNSRGQGWEPVPPWKI